MDYVLINNKQAHLICNSSKGKDWSIENAGINTLKILDELTKFQDSSMKYEKGITIANPLTTVQLVSNLDITRPSNHIGILRKELPSNTVFTFKFDGDKLPKYGIAKSKKSLKDVKDFRERLLRHISSKENAKNVV